MNPIKIYIADDQIICRLSLKLLVERYTESTVIGETGDGREALEDICRLEPDLAIIDLTLPHLDGLEICGAVMQSAVRTKLILWTSYAKPDLFQEAMALGIHGFLDKEMNEEEIRRAVNSVMSGERWVTKRFGNDLYYIPDSPFQLSRPLS